MIRFGIVGAGNIAHTFAEDVKFSKDAVITAVASRDLNKAEAFKEQYDIQYAFGSYEELAKSDKVDAIYIATPHNFHMEQSVLFMNHKKHVLCEKPIAVNVEEFEKMVAAAKENNVLLMEAMWTRFLPVTLEVREIVKSKKLGKLKHADIEFGFDMKGRAEEGRLFNINLAGGSLLDVGIYPVAYTLNITDKPIKTIEATASFYKTGIDTECIINIVFEDESTAELISSFKENRNNIAVLDYEKGKVIVQDFWSSQKYFINDEEFSLPHIGNGFSYQIDSFVDTLDKGLLENSIMTHDQTRKTMVLLDKIREIIGLKYPFE